MTLKKKTRQWKDERYTTKHYKEDEATRIKQKPEGDIRCFVSCSTKECRRIAYSKWIFDDMPHAEGMTSTLQ